MLTQARLKELYRYNPETGVFTNRVSRGRGGKAGGVAGCKNKATGYIDMVVDKVRQPAHRFAFLYMTGELPNRIVDVDHINGIRDDNRWENLRLCTRQQNLQNKMVQTNSKSGVKGVHWNKASQRWCAQIKYEGKIVHVGLFHTIEAAKHEIKFVRERLHGEFARHS